MAVTLTATKLIFDFGGPGGSFFAKMVNLGPSRTSLEEVLEDVRQGRIAEKEASGWRTVSRVEGFFIEIKDS